MQRKNNTILEVKTLRKVFHKKGVFTTAIDGVNLYLEKGETLGLIGESGSGKTTIGRTITRLHKPTSGQILIDGVDVAAKKLDKEDSKLLRESVQMIFQDPYSSLNEQKNIMNIVAEPIRTLKLDKKYVEEIRKNEDEIRKYYKVLLKNEYWDSVLAFRIKANEVAIKFYDEIINNLRDITLDKPFKKQNIDYLFSQYYTVKFAANEVLSNEVLSIPGNLFGAWKNAQNKIETGKLYSKEEKALFTAERSFKKAEKNASGSQRYIKAAGELEALEGIKKEFDVLFHKFKVINKKNINNVVNEYKMAEAVITKTAQKSDTFKYYNTKMIDAAIANVLYKTAKEIRVQSEYISDNVIQEFMNAFAGISFAISDMYKEARKANGKYKFNVKQILNNKVVQDVIEKLKKNNIHNEAEANDVVFKIFVNKNKGIKYKKYNVLIADIEKASNLVNEYKVDDVEQKYIDKVNEEKVNLNKVKEECDAFIQSFIDNNHKEILLKKAKVDEKLEILNKTLEVKRSVSKKLFDERLAEINAMDIPSFENELLAKKASTYKKVVKKLIKKNEDTNNVVEKEIQRTLSESKVIKKFIVDGNVSKRTIKNLIVRNKVFEALNDSGLTKAHAYRYPHEFSGGMRQRVGIARAIIAEPRIIIADEPIAALDLSIQAQIVNMLKKLQKDRNMSMIFIAHDLSMVKYISDRLAIIHLGKIVETGTPKEIFENPIHPYTKNLISSMPDISNISKGFSKMNFDNEYLEEYKRDVLINIYDVTKTHKVAATSAQFKKWTSKK